MARQKGRARFHRQLLRVVMEGWLVISSADLLYGITVDEPTLGKVAANLEIHDASHGLNGATCWY